MRPRLRPVERRGPSVWLWVIGAVAAALVAFVAYNYYAVHNGGQPVGTADGAGQPASTVQPSAGSPSPAAPNSGRCDRDAARRAERPGRALRGESWVRVTVDGAVAMEGIYPPGTKALQRKGGDVRVGNAAGVALTVDGRDLGTLGPAGDVVERTFKLARE